MLRAQSPVHSKLRSPTRSWRMILLNPPLPTSEGLLLVLGRLLGLSQGPTAKPLRYRILALMQSEHKAKRFPVSEAASKG